MSNTGSHGGAWLPTVDAALLALLAIGLVTALILGTTPAHRDETAVTPASITDLTDTGTTNTGTTNIQPAPANDVVTDAELARRLQRYVTSYSKENALGLSRLMTGDIVRESAGGPTLVGRRAVLAEYQRQFDANGTTGYRLDAPSISRTDGAVTLEATYTITTTNAPPSTGSITMHVVRAPDGEILIDHIGVRAD
jgi:hypothetical protein